MDNKLYMWLSQKICSFNLTEHFMVEGESLILPIAPIGCYELSYELCNDPHWILFVVCSWYVLVYTYWCMPVHATSSFKANAATSWNQSRWASHGRRRSTAGSCWIKLWRLFVSLSVTKLVQTIRTFSLSSQLLVFPYCPYFCQCNILLLFTCYCRDLSGLEMLEPDDKLNEKFWPQEPVRNTALEC